MTFFTHVMLIQWLASARVVAVEVVVGVVVTKVEVVMAWVVVCESVVASSAIMNMDLQITQVIWLHAHILICYAMYNSKNNLLSKLTLNSFKTKM